jgi:hypothetical protein
MLITNRELAALIQLADRAPKSMAEQVWLEMITKRINAQIEKDKENAEKP